MEGNRNGLTRLLGGLLLPAAAVAALVWFAAAVDGLDRGRAEEDQIGRAHV